MKKPSHLKWHTFCWDQAIHINQYLSYTKISQTKCHIAQRFTTANPDFKNNWFAVQHRDEQRSTSSEKAQKNELKK